MDFVYLVVFIWGLGEISKVYLLDVNATKMLATVFDVVYNCFKELESFGANLC